MKTVEVTEEYLITVAGINRQVTLKGRLAHWVTSLRDNTMTATLLLAILQPFFQGGYLDPDKPGLLGLLRSRPEDEKVYIAIAEEVFADCIHNADDPTYLSFERTVDILSALLYLDGRSELGLLRIAKLAF